MPSSQRCRNPRRHWTGRLIRKLLTLVWRILDHVLNDSVRPLSSIGVPYYRDTLLSAWPSHMVFEVGAPIPKIDPLILKNSKPTSDGPTWGPNPRTRRRNQAVEYVRMADKNNGSLMAPKFLSEKARTSSDAYGERKQSETLETMTTKLDSVTKKDVPFYYANVEIKYSKFGVEDFDFACVFLSRVLI